MPHKFSLLCGGTPVSGELHTGFFVIPQGDQWSVTDSEGVVTAATGPRTLRVMGAKLTKRRSFVANESEYLEVRFVAGHSEVVPGPASLFEDPLLHQQVLVKPGLNINNNEALIVYRDETDKSGDKKVQREVIRGPVLYKPRFASEWNHKFSWHGHDPSGGDLCRKRPHGLRFEKILLAPCGLYYDVENVRTADDALLTVRLMIFYKLESIEAMLDATNDPIADIINSVSSDVIGFCSARSFEQFKESAEQLNIPTLYQNLNSTVAVRGFSVSKVVFRGYVAQARLQKMHDDAIERRTKLVLERESELQEQKLKDERLEKEAQRDATKRGMELAQAEHVAAMARNEFVARQRELAEAEEQKAQQQAKRHTDELDHLTQLQARLGLQGADMAQLLVAKAHGTPAKLVQIVGDSKPVVHLDESK